jgi:hypothetical protein
MKNQRNRLQRHYRSESKSYWASLASHSHDFLIAFFLVMNSNTSGQHQNRNYSTSEPNPTQYFLFDSHVAFQSSTSTFCYFFIFFLVHFSSQYFLSNLVLMRMLPFSFQLHFFVFFFLPFFVAIQELLHFFGRRLSHADHHGP